MSIFSPEYISEHRSETSFGTYVMERDLDAGLWKSRLEALDGTVIKLADCDDYASAYRICGADFAQRLLPTPPQEGET